MTFRIDPDQSPEDRAADRSIKEWREREARAAERKRQIQKQRKPSKRGEFARKLRGGDDDDTDPKRKSFGDRLLELVSKGK